MSIIISRGASNIKTQMQKLISKKVKIKLKFSAFVSIIISRGASNIETQTKHSSRKIKKSEKFIFRIIENKAKVFGYCVDNYNIASNWR